jgi:hypothetical protein
MRLVRTSSICLHIRPSFVILAFLFAIFARATMPISLLMMGVLFLVFFLHELGHVIVARLLGRPCDVIIGGAGGRTDVLGPPLRFWQRTAVRVGGLVATYLVIVGTRMWLFDEEMLPATLRECVYTLYTFSLGWFWFNLLPLCPFDGGQLCLDIGGSLFGRIGERVAAVVCMLAAFLFALCLLGNNLFLGVLVSLYCMAKAFSVFRHPTMVHGSDQSEEALLLQELRQRWHNGEQGRVIEELKQLARTAKQKEIRQEAVGCASEYLLVLEQPREAYELLTAAKDPLLSSSLEHLALAAYQTSHWSEGLFAGREAFRQYPSPSVATLCAMLAAREEKAAEAIHWLQTALSLGVTSMASIIEAEDFDSIRSSDAFHHFLATSRVR